MRRNARVDTNHKQIVEGLRDVGASVVSLAAIGRGVPDLLVGYRGVNYLLEVKTAKGKLTADQIEFTAMYNGRVFVVRDIGEAYVAIGVFTYAEYIFMQTGIKQTPLGSIDDDAIAILQGKP